MLSKHIYLIIFLLHFFVGSNLIAQNQSRIDSIQKILNNTTNGIKKADLLNLLSETYDDINIQQLTFAEQAEKISSKLNYPKGLAQSYLNQGFYFCGQLRNHALAKPFFEKAQHCFTKVQERELLADINLRIGAYINQNVPSSLSKKYLLKAFEIYNRLNDQNKVAATAKELALSYAILKQKDSSLMYLGKYIKFTLATGVDFQKAEMYSFSAHIYGEYFNNTAMQLESFRLAANLYESLINSSKSKPSHYYAYAVLHTNMCNSSWLKNQLSDLKNNSLEVIRLCDIAESKGLSPSITNPLRSSAFAFLIRKSIKEKDSVAAEHYINQGIDCLERRKDFYQLGRLLWTIESSWWRFFDYVQAYKFQQKELEAWEKVGNRYWKCIAMANMAMVYGRLGDYERQIQIIRDLLTISKTSQVTAFTLYASKDMARSFYLIGKMDSASWYVRRSEELNNENENSFITMVLLYIKALIAEKRGDYSQAIPLLKNALAIKNKYAYPTNTYDQVAPENALGRIYLKKREYDHALPMAQKSLQNSEKENMKDMQSSDYLTLALIYKLMGDFEQATLCLEKHITLGVDLAKDEAEKSIHKRELFTINKKNDFERKILLRENKLKIEELKIQRKLSWIFSIGFFIFLILSYFLFKSYKIKKKDNKLLSEQKEIISDKNNELQFLNEEISAHRDNLYALNEQSKFQNFEIIEQNKQIIRQQKDITDSIIYASRIQQAMLPSFEELTVNFPNSFVLFLPRDIVSGDFYWVKQVKNQLYILAADCTGHGVPGAFMSMLGISLMNEMISSRHIDPPNMVLNELRKRLKRSLHQDSSLSDSKDGMDASLVLLDLETLTLQFSGAYNSLYLLKKIKSKPIQLGDESDLFDYELLSLDADRMPIGVHPNDDKSFTNHEVQLDRGDSFYIFSDGYVSQFGGEKGGKFKTKPFKELLSSIQSKNLREQKQILYDRFETWRGLEWEQVDDILILGVRV